MNNDFARMVGDYLKSANVREERLKMVRDILIGGACLFALLLAATYPTKAHAVQLDHQGCVALAVWHHDVVLMREVGADKEKVRAYFEKHKDEFPIYVLLLRKFEEIWANKQPLGEIANPVYQDCVKRRGNYGTEV